MSGTNKSEIADLESALAKIKELETVNGELTKEVLALEDENENLKIETISVANEGCGVVEFNGKTYKANAAAYHNDEDKVIVLNKKVLEKKQNIFGKERVRLASSEDLQKLIEDKSNLITIIQN